MTDGDLLQIGGRCLVAVFLTLIAIRLRGKLDGEHMVVVVPSLAVFSIAGPLVVVVLAVLSESSSLAAFFAYGSLLFVIPGLFLKSAWAIPCLAIGFSLVPTFLNINLPRLGVEKAPVVGKYRQCDPQTKRG